MASVRCQQICSSFLCELKTSSFGLLNTHMQMVSLVHMELLHLFCVKMEMITLISQIIMPYRIQKQHCSLRSNVVLSWASYQIREIAVCACAGNAGNVFPHRRFRRRPLVSDPGMHHGTCVTHVPWCMSGSLTCGGGENVPGIPGACAPAILRIWQEAH